MQDDIKVACSYVKQFNTVKVGKVGVDGSITRNFNFDESHGW